MTKKLKNENALLKEALIMVMEDAVKRGGRKPNATNPR